ncbi:ribosome biogenesis GTPase Der [Candidatus Dependentiae bacterium]|nr:ribosome biogenesis GTPase Der [Candidatus Dependentiae bacterium]
MKKINYPKVLLVGRTNVGKSTLFNRFINDKKSIVFDQEGVTRDYLEEIITRHDKPFALIDTGGMQFRKNIDPIDALVFEKVEKLFEVGKVILFVVDVKAGVTHEDRQIAKKLHKLNKPIILLLNKADNLNLLLENEGEFASLGFKEIIKTSALHGTGILETLDRVTELLPDTTTQEVAQPHCQIAIIGKPNVGKSSLMNLLIHQERSIVSDVAGTTREAISESIYHLGDLVQITDTPGIRKKARVTEDLETLMVKSSLQSVREADIVILVIDASAGPISDQELKLLFLVYEAKKPLMVAFNKTDLVSDYSEIMLEQSQDQYDFILKKLPCVSVSCKSKKNVGKILNHIQKVLTRSKQDFSSSEVDELVKKELESRPLFHSGVKLKLFKIRQIEGKIPTFVLHVNHPQWFGPAEFGCIENILRKHFDLKGCPIQFYTQKV